MMIGAALVTIEPMPGGIVMCGDFRMSSCNRFRLFERDGLVAFAEMEHGRNERLFILQAWHPAAVVRDRSVDV